MKYATKTQFNVGEYGCRRGRDLSFGAAAYPEKQP